jgi:hypothetical protein
MLRGVLVTALLTGALAGCSSDPEPRTLPPVPSASPTAAAPLPVPPEATPATPQGAAAFARYYLGLMNQAFSTRDSSLVRRVSDPGCGGCNNLIGAIDESPEEGERVEGGKYVVAFAEAPPVEEGDVIVEVRYSLTEVRVLAPDGSLIRRTPPVENVDAQMRLLRRGNAWIVAGFRNVES